MTSDFRGKGVVVTGAAQGIGAGIARYFGEQDARVVLMDIDGKRVAETAASLGGNAVAVSGDVSVRADVKRAVDICAEQAGNVDVMVAHAGIADVRPLLEVTDAQWQRVFDINVNGVFLCAQEGARAMRGRGGAIVVTASTNATQAEENLVAYSASKGAVVAFVRAAGLDLARHGVRINAVAPGVINTRISRWVIEDPLLGPEFLKKIPLGRFGEPADIARAVGFLAGEDSAYMTGQTLVLDGGYSLGFPIEPVEADLPGSEADPAGAQGGTS